MNNTRPPLDPQLKRDFLKLGFLSLTLMGSASIFVLAPSLSSPTLLSVVAAMILSPWVSALQRRGHSRNFSIFLVFLFLGGIFTCLGFWGIRAGTDEWSSFKIAAPEHFYEAIRKLSSFETFLKKQYPVLSTVQITKTLLKSGNETGQWFVDHGASLVGLLLTWVFIIPIMTWILLSEGRNLQREFLQLVPNRYFEQFLLITSKILEGISDYLRAKLIEATLVGMMTTVGLIIVGAPYVIVLGIIAGITNIIPYVGPIIGAVPGIFLSTFHPDHSNSLMIAVAGVYLVANAVDTFVIFPLLVAKLINLHPAMLLIIVAIGQNYYGLVGMLISVPIATSIKVVIHEIYIAIYEYRPIRDTELPNLD
jgi:putative permease